MRQFITIAAVVLLFATPLHSQVKPGALTASEDYSINEFAISHARPVSFSIGYPKGWTSPDSRLYESDGVARDSEVVCSFWSDPASSDPASIHIWRIGRATAKEDAEAYARRASGTSKPLNLVTVQTKAGASGYLVMLEKDRRTLSDFFFHVGPKGAIRISIITKAEDSTLREHLQDLVLQTLRF